MPPIWSNSDEINLRQKRWFSQIAVVYVGVGHPTGDRLRFCKRFLSFKVDPLGKTNGQMNGAARSGRQNIIEGAERAMTSQETEIKLTAVARASLAELSGAFEMFLVSESKIPWAPDNPEFT